MKKLSSYNFYQYLVNEVREDLYVFAEENAPLKEDWGESFYVNSMQLVIGTERAVLIDTGYGLGDLIPFIRQYTDLPVTLLITHGHYDHWRGANQFTDIYMSKIEEASIEEEKKRSGRAFTAKDIQEGDVFDLGGIVLEAIHVPGHSYGSMCFLDRKNKTLFTGDAVNKLPWVFGDGGTLEQYHHALVRLRDLTPERPDIFCGHSLKPFPYQVLLDGIAACEDVLSGDNANDPAYNNPLSQAREPFPNTFMHQVGEVRLCYKAEFIR